MGSPRRSDRLLLFRLGRREFALPSSEIDGVSESVRVRPVPGSPPEILGLAEWRGRILSVLDLPLLLDAAADPQPACLLRLAAPFQFCALRLPAPVRLVRDDAPRRSAAVTLVQVGELMRRVGVGRRGSS